MSITRVGTQTASATTVTVPAHQAGDLILIWAMHGGATTIPALPSGYTSILTKTESTSVALGTRVGYKIATGTSDTSGTWTNASELICAVYRPSVGYTLGIGQSASSNSTTDTINYPALSPMGDANSGNSWVLGLVAASNLTQVLTTAFTGMTSVTSVAGASYQAALADTNAGVSSWSSTNQTVTGTAGKSVSATVEIVLLPGTSATLLTSHVYQHVKGGGNPYANNAASTTPFAYTIPVNWTSGSGNTLIVQITYDGGIAAPTVVGAVNGTFTAGPTALGGTGNQDTRSYYVQGITAGQETITVTFGVSTRAFGVDAITELYAVATSGGLAGSSSVAFSTTLGAGSFTPTNNNGTGGNFIWSSFVQAEQIPAGTTPMIYAGANFTLLGTDTGWNDSGGDGENFAKAQEGYLQTTSAAINPSVAVMGQGADHWNSLAMAFKVSAGSGTAPPANYIAGASFLSTTHYPASGTYSFQASFAGNLRVLQSPDPNLNALTVTDSEGNTWSSDGTAKPAFWYFANASANPNLSIFITGGGTDTTLSFRTFDLVGAAPAPFDSAINVADAFGAVTTYTPTNKISPSNTNGIVLYGVGLGQGPATAVTAPSGAVWQYPYFTGELDSDLAVNADIGAYYLNTASGSITATFTITANAGNSSSGGIIAFKWASPAVSAQASEDVAAVGPTVGMRRGTPFSRLHAMLGYTNAASGNVTLTLGGQSIASTLGTITASVAYTVTGLSVTSTEGTATYGVSYPVLGRAITSTEGIVVPALGYVATGQSAVSTEGTVGSAPSYALTGEAIASTEGAVGYSVSYGLTGEVLTSTEGTISASTGGNVTLSLGGQLITSTEGTITAALSTALSGLALTSTEGTASYTVSYSPAGQALVSTEGTVTDGVAYGVTGESATFAEGAISASTGGNVTLTLSGLSAVFSEGTIAVALSSSVAGQAVASSEGVVPRGVAPTIAGQSITSTEGVIAPSWSTSAVLAGQGISISLGTITPQVQYSLPGTGTNQFVSATVKGSFESATIAGSFRAGNN